MTLTRPLSFREGEAFAREMDDSDPLGSYRDRFLIPERPDGRQVGYFCGNSLGLQPTSARELIEEELGKWAVMGVHGHFAEGKPWYAYQALLGEQGAHLVGARPSEVVMMNGLTVNLHLMMVTFYRPTPDRYEILVEDPCFPSDTYAVKTQIRFHGLDPRNALVVARPRPGEACIRKEDIEEIIDRRGESIALVLVGGVNFFTGQALDMQGITAAARRKGCVVGFDLAHAAGNVPLHLHDWDVDFAVWCNYKYLNSGPGAVGGCFVHERHATRIDLQRFGGWWGNDPATRFRMQLDDEFIPTKSADGWQLSNPPILAMAPMRASLEIFSEAGMPRLRRKSELLTGYLEFLVGRLAKERVTIITPREPEERGCQLSIRVHERPRETRDALEQAGMICDFREPDVIRVAPVPLYNRFHDVYRFSQVLARLT